MKFLVITALLVFSTLVVAHYGNFDTNNCHEENGLIHCHSNNGDTFLFPKQTKRDPSRVPSSADVHQTIKETKIECERKSSKDCNEMEE